VLRHFENRFPVVLTQSLAWDAFALPAACWAILALTILLLVVVAKGSPQPAGAEPAS
jgi:hypothetical protein